MRGLVLDVCRKRMAIAAIQHNAAARPLALPVADGNCRNCSLGQAKQARLGDRARTTRLWQHSFEGKELINYQIN